MSETQTVQHGLTPHSDGGWDFDAPVQTRSERFKSTSVDEFPAVTGREVNWKFAPIDKLDALLNGNLDGSRLPVSVESDDPVSVEWISPSSDLVGRAGIPEDRASANAWGAVAEVMHLTVSGEGKQTIVMTRENLENTPRAAHTIIESEPHSSGLVIMEHKGSAHLSENIEIVVGEESHLTVVSVQQWNDDAIHLASHFAEVRRGGNLIHIVVSLGGEVVRVNPSIHLNHEGGNAEALGAYFADAGQHLEHQVFMDHNAPNVRGRVNYKGALQGEGARTVWIGDVLIQRAAEGTDSYEQNRNLVLSEGTRADSIPNLEIETGDIAGAGHASATGRFDEEHLFYLMSRGIPEDEARKLVVRGFLIEVISRIGDEATEQRLQQAIEDELLKSVFA